MPSTPPPTWCAAFGSRRCAMVRASCASLIWQSAMQVRVAVEALEKRQGVHERAVEVNRLENAADDVHDEALRRLFDEEKNAITVIKWKEMFDLLEEATDRCEDVANVARRRRRQARLSACGLRSRRPRHLRRPGLRLHQRLPRRGELDRDRRLDARADARARP